jgi:uncharacterized protein YidB (DUF937 family)
MGLLDQLMGAGTGSANAGLLESVVGMLTGNQGGGLQAVVKALGDKGLGDIAGSWVGTGANLPVSAQQIQGALGPQLQQLAAQHGLDVNVVAQQLSQHLPGMVDKLTPGGRLPDASSLQGLLKGLLS